jgi:hypothetical protein
MIQYEADQSYASPLYCPDVVIVPSLGDIYIYIRASSKHASPTYVEILMKRPSNNPYLLE